MGIEKLVPLALVLAVAAAYTGQLPKIINAVRRAQLILIQEYKASKWGNTLDVFQKPAPVRSPQSAH